MKCRLKNELWMQSLFLSPARTVVCSTRRGSARSAWTNTWTSSPIRFGQSWLRRSRREIQSRCNGSQEMHPGLPTECTHTRPATNWSMVIPILLENQLENADFSLWPMVLYESAGCCLCPDPEEPCCSLPTLNTQIINRRSCAAALKLDFI